MLTALRAVLSRRGRPGWLVGGALRDRELGRFSADLDVVVDDDPGAIARAVADELRLPCFSLSQKFGTYRVVGRTGHLDVTEVRGGNLEADLALRDFTVNAMARPVEGGELVDPFGGREDLATRRLLAVRESIFEDDALRLLRAARIAHTLDFALGAELQGRIRAEAWRLAEVAAERVLSEIVLTFEAGRSAAATSLWDDLGLLAVLFPEIIALRGVAQSRFHHLDVYGHTLEAMSWTDEIIADPARWFPRTASFLISRFEEPLDGMMSRRAALRLAVLLHDVAKPQTRVVDPEGRVLFWGHTQLGAKVAGDICARLRCSGRVTALVQRVVERHLSLGFLQHENPLSSRSEVEYLWAAAPFEPEVIAASVADRLAARGPLVEDRFISGHIAVAELLMERWRRRALEGPQRPPLDGGELARGLGISPGPILGKVVREVTLAWEAGEVASRAQVLRMARTCLDGLDQDPAD